MFVHGGVLPEHADYGLERINQETADWLMGKSGDRMPDFLAGRKAVVWAREYSAGKFAPVHLVHSGVAGGPLHDGHHVRCCSSGSSLGCLHGCHLTQTLTSGTPGAEDARRCECDTLRQALAKIPGATRMVVGHTIQVSCSL